MDYSYTSEKGNNIWLMEGDCLDRMKEIPDGSVDMVMCDPPYGTTQNKWDSVINLDLMWEQLWRVLKPNGAVVLCASQPFTSVLTCSQIKYWKTQWVWSKNKGTGHLNAKKMPMRFHETLEVFYKKPPTYNPQKTTGHKPANYAMGNVSVTENYGDQVSTVYKGGNTDRQPRNIIEIPVINNDGSSADGKKIHSTQKPVALMEYMLKTYSNEGDIILDFTMGSGATIKAANNLDRNVIGIENGYCAKKDHEWEGVHWTDIVRECVE